MTTQTQGRNIIAELPARAIVAIAGHLSSTATIETKVMVGQADLAARERSLQHILDLGTVRDYLMQKALYQPADAVVRVRIPGRVHREALAALERVDTPTNAELVAEAITALQEFPES